MPSHDPLRFVRIPLPKRVDQFFVLVEFLLLRRFHPDDSIDKLDLERNGVVNLHQSGVAGKLDNAMVQIQRLFQ